MFRAELSHAIITVRYNCILFYLLKYTHPSTRCYQRARLPPLRAENDGSKVACFRTSDKSML